MTTTNLLSGAIKIDLLFGTGYNKSIVRIGDIETGVEPDWGLGTKMLAWGLGQGATMGVRAGWSYFLPWIEWSMILDENGIFVENNIINSNCHVEIRMIYIDTKY